ncbi:hypothetical protein BN1013_01967 [Candidatus Rubidus massiliensis]|nr:hypothetical protein BN1013_01967 [Candidatus Rubidus massiliensis]
MEPTSRIDQLVQRTEIGLQEGFAHEQNKALEELTNKSLSIASNCVNELVNALKIDTEEDIKIIQSLFQNIKTNSSLDITPATMILLGQLAQVKKDNTRLKENIETVTSNIIMQIQQANYLRTEVTKMTHTLKKYGAQTYGLENSLLDSTNRFIERRNKKTL